MPWIPTYKITAGLLAGKKTPAGGSLQGLYDFPSVSRQQSGNVRFAQRFDFANDSWEGAFGTNCTEELIDHAMASYESGNLGEWYLLAEIEIPNDEGAQYYKQSYVIEIQDSTGCGYRENTVTRAGVEYHCKWFIGQWSYRVSRYQYDTPYSGYTRTDLTANSNRSFGSGTRIVQGSADDVYYAYNGVWDWRRILMALGSFTSSDNKECFGVAMYGERDAIPTYRLPEPNPDNRRSFGVIGQTVEWLDSLYGVFEPEESEDPNEDPNNPGDEEEGGDGDHERPVDEIPFPDLPYTGAANAGFVTLYKLGPAEMWVFAQSFFTDTLLEILRDFFGNPMDIFVGLSLVPYIPDGNEMWYPLIGGHYISRQALTKVSSQYTVLDFGSISIEPYGKNVYDFEPYTRIMIWLPYIGYRELPVDEVMGKNIHVKYYCDCLSGDCVAMISTQVMPQGILPPRDVIIAQYNGSIATQVPVASESYDNLVSNVVNAAIGGTGNMSASAFRSGDSNGGIAAAGVGALMSTAAGFVNGMKTSHKRDGSAGATAGFLSIQYPYIIRHIPNQSLPSNFRNIMGYPSNIGGTLGDGFNGFAAVEDIQLNNIPAMEPEREEIMTLLREGVII